MTIEKAPAWKVRDNARNKFLEGIKDQIKDHEKEFDDRLDLYRILILVLIRRLSPRGLMSMSSMYDLPALPREKRKAVQTLLIKDIAPKIAVFGHSEVEGAALFAKLLEWAVDQLTWPYHQSLEEEEFELPRIHFGAASASDEIPVE